MYTSIESCMFLLYVNFNMSFIHSYKYDLTKFQKYCSKQFCKRKSSITKTYKIPLVHIYNLSFIHSGKLSTTKTYKIPLVHIYNLSFIHSGKSSIAGNILRCRYSIEDLSGEYDTVYK
jgi:hypothetical protein